MGLDTGRYPIIPCLLSVCFDDAMHGRYASFYVNKGIKSLLLVLSLCLHKMKHISHVSQIKTKTTKGMG